MAESGGRRPSDRSFEAFMPPGELVKTASQQDAVAVHGILQKHANQDEASSEILINFLSYLKGSIFVAHHAAFDFGIKTSAIVARNLITERSIFARMQN